MECVFGLVGDGFVLLAADTSAVHSILVHKSNEDKIMVLDSHRVQFTEYIQKNVALYNFRNGIPLTTSAAANFTRSELATALGKVILVLICYICWLLARVLLIVRVRVHFSSSMDLQTGF